MEAKIKGIVDESGKIVDYVLDESGELYVLPNGYSLETVAGESVIIDAHGVECELGKAKAPCPCIIANRKRVYLRRADTWSSGIPDRVKRFRFMAKMSQEELAIASGVSLHYISTIECGRVRDYKKITLEIVVNLANVLGVTVDELIGLSEGSGE